MIRQCTCGHGVGRHPEMYSSWITVPGERGRCNVKRCECAGWKLAEEVKAK